MLAILGVKQWDSRVGAVEVDHLISRIGQGGELVSEEIR